MNTVFVGLSHRFRMLFENILKRLYVRRLRRVLRGHRVLKKSDSLEKINTANIAFTTTGCIKDGFYSKIIFGAAANSAELAIRQYLLMRLAGVQFGKAILYTHGKMGAKVVYPLPPEWRKIVNEHGFEVATVRSTVLWNALVIIFLAYGIMSIGKTFLRGIKEIIKPSLPALGRYAFFDGLSVNNFPRSPEDGFGQDIISWYQRWPGRTSELDAISHTVKSVTQARAIGVPLFSLRSAISPPTKLTTLFRYLGWGVAASVIATIDFFRGRWWHAVLLSEASKAALMRMHQSDQLARDYLFHNSSWIYRPLWTYEAEAKGSRIILYFYSTNIEAFKRPGRDPLRAYCGYQAMTWPRYLVWDEYQADFVRRVACGDPCIDVVGSIHFSDNTNKMPALPARTVAVFDVQPVRDVFYNTLAIDFDYYTPTTANQFLIDVHEILKEVGCSLALKRKRDIGRLAHPAYRRFVEEFEKLPHCIHVDPDVAAVNVIEGCIAIISTPFTSTALLGRALGKPSVYYDPNGMIQKDDQAAHGIDILCGQDELRVWLKSVVV